MGNKKRLLCKVFLTLVFVLSIVFSGITNSYAGSLNEVNLNVNILENGDAVINMVWDSAEDEGTEIYIPIENLKDSKVTDLVVKENGVVFEPQSEWDTDLSRDEKTHKSGILETSNGYEICWGIGEGENHRYEVSYKITNMVKQLNDYQMIYWQFINPGMKNPPEKVNLSVRSDKKFNEDNTRFWEFGFEGQGSFNNGEINIENNQSFNDSNKLVLLMRLNKDMFNTNSLIDEDFQYYQEKAFDRSSYTMETAEEAISRKKTEKNIRNVFLGFLAAGIGAITLAIVGSKKVSEKPYIDVSKYKGEYYRDIPYKGHMEDIFYLFENINLSSYDKYLNYFLLKWIKEGVVESTTYTQGLFKTKKDGLKILKAPENPGVLEKKFYDFTVEAAKLSSEDGKKVLREKDFKTWMEKNDAKFNKFINEFSLYSMKKSKEQGYIEGKTNKFLIFKKYVQTGTKEGIELQENLVKFKNYLKDFSLLDERQSFEVNIWDEYMMYAAIFGITKEVEKEFRKIAPQYFEQTTFDTNTLLMCYIYSNSINNYHANAGISGSAGMGGMSSIGGGGGSFGGGFGGGAR